MLFLHYMQMNAYFFPYFLFRNTQIITTLVIPDKAKVNAKLYVETLLPRLIEERKSLLQFGFIFQQDAAPAHTEKLVQDWIATDCSEFIVKD